MLAKYPLFYGWVVVSFVTAAATMAGAHSWDLGSWSYIHLYFWGRIASSLFAAGILVQIHRICGRRGAAGWNLFAFLLAALFFADAWLSSSSITYWLLFGAINAYLTFSAGIAIWRGANRFDLSLGRNYWAILLGILLPSALVASDHVAYFSKFPFWSPEVFGHLQEPIRMLGWLLIALGMRVYDPPGNDPSGSEQEEILKAMKRGWKLLRSSA